MWVPKAEKTVADVRNAAKAHAHKPKLGPVARDSQPTTGNHGHIPPSRSRTKKSCNPNVPSRIPACNCLARRLNSKFVAAGLSRIQNLGEVVRG
eukprot:scaffold2487_cov161-Prasinococcus_capsulatus_cf.AAC.1